MSGGESDRSVWVRPCAKLDGSCKGGQPNPNAIDTATLERIKLPAIDKWLWSQLRVSTIDVLVSHFFHASLNRSCPYRSLSHSCDYPRPRPRTIITVLVVMISGLFLPPSVVVQLDESFLDTAYTNFETVTLTDEATGRLPATCVFFGNDYAMWQPYDICSGEMVLPPPRYVGSSVSEQASERT